MPSDMLLVRESFRRTGISSTQFRQSDGNAGRSMPLTFQAISFGWTITMARRRSQFSPRTAGPAERLKRT
jgi:hypothetical protein